MELSRAFKRPRSANELTKVRPQLVKLVKSGDLQHVRFNYYYVSNWFNKLKDEWRIRDMFTVLVIQLVRMSQHESLSQDNDPAVLRDAARGLRKFQNNVDKLVALLEARAENLEIEDTPTEATD